ncbi:MAG: hypothetical protein HY996_11270 [Micrococcales bacterium]|nr:hypothetical protein [Micrococcales bacterium]
MTFIWATCGRTWGFRFLQRGGLSDPLPAYSAAFAGFDAVPEVFERVGDRVVLRFNDPLGRVDEAGRVIPHDFVFVDGISDEVVDVAGGRDFIWPQVRDAYADAYG